MCKDVDTYTLDVRDIREPGMAGPPAPANEGQMIAQVIERLMTPFVEAMARAMKNNTEALDRVAAQQKVQNDRLEAMERQIRLQTPVTATQVRYVGDAIRKQARTLLDARSVADDQKAVRTLSGMIRKSVLMRYGVSALSEIPRHEYQVVLTQVQTWNDALCVRDVVKEARSRKEEMV